MDVESYNFTKKLSKDNKNIIPCFGIHPWEAHNNYKKLDMFESYIRECKVIGEIGLDFVWVTEKDKYPSMISVFEYFISKAREYNKITNMHTKGAEEKILTYIKEYELKSPIIHWYSGDLEVLKKLIDYGCYFTISVDIGYSSLTEEIVKLVPLNKILTETDGPTSLEWVNGKYGYPHEVKNIVKQISAIKRLPYEETRNEIFQNLKLMLEKEGVKL